jgi:hypothetical protein
VSRPPTDLREPPPEKGRKKVDLSDFPRSFETSTAATCLPLRQGGAGQRTKWGLKDPFEVCGNMSPGPGGGGGEGSLRWCFGADSHPEPTPLYPGSDRFRRSEPADPCGTRSGAGPRGWHQLVRAATSGPPPSTPGYSPSGTEVGASADPTDLPRHRSV